MIITLQIKGTDEVRDFERSHALRVLRLPKSVYTLPKDSPYQFVDNELRRIKSEETGGEATKKRTSTRSKKSRK